MALNKLDYPTHVENDGATSEGELSAAEFNEFIAKIDEVVDAINTIQTDIGTINTTLTNLNSSIGVNTTALSQFKTDLKVLLKEMIADMWASDTTDTDIDNGF